MDRDKISSILSKLNFYADVRISTGKTSLFSIEDEKINGTSGEISGIGVRVLKNRNFGYAWSTKIQDFENLLKKAETLTRLSRIRSNFSFSHQKNIKANTGKHFEFPSPEEKIFFLRKAKKAGAGRKIKSIMLALHDGNIEKNFLSSEGSDIIQKISYVYFSATVIAKQGALIQRGRERIASHIGYKDFDIEKAVIKASRGAERLLKAQPAPKGEFSLIMDSEMSGVFSHEVIGHASEGDSITERESIFANKLGKKIVNKKISIIDDPTFKGFGQYSYDDEGVKGRPVHILKNGVLKACLHSRQSAFELKTKSNGHARAQDHEHAPIVRMSNTFFAKGKNSIEDIFDIKQGIYVVGMKGGSVDIFKGNFMFGAKEGWLIKNGEKEKCLRDVYISGNIFEVLDRVECVGNDLVLFPGFCGKNGQSVPVASGGPHIRISKIRIG